MISKIKFWLWWNLWASTIEQENYSLTIFGAVTQFLNKRGKVVVVNPYTIYKLQKSL